ncbi:MAG TPA: hypothetical protein VFD36_15510, partial [Kofleriaceae bacterium]|nr:hypothetical protein [Kofleriaceae bacterium]
MTARRHPDAAQARPPPTQVPAPERTARVRARGEGHSASPPPPPRTSPPPSQPSSPPRFDFAALQLHRDPPARAAAAPAIHAAALAGIRGSGQALPHRERGGVDRGRGGCASRRVAV